MYSTYFILYYVKGMDMAKSNKTYEKPVRQPKLKLPEYVKPINSILKEVKVGREVNLTVRVMKDDNMGWTTMEIDGIISEVAPNALILHGKPFGVPYYTIHDWELL